MGWLIFSCLRSERLYHEYGRKILNVYARRLRRAFSKQYDERSNRAVVYEIITYILLEYVLNGHINFAKTGKIYIILFRNQYTHTHAHVYLLRDSMAVYMTRFIRIYHDIVIKTSLFDCPYTGFLYDFDYNPSGYVCVCRT